MDDVLLIVIIVAVFIALFFAAFLIVKAKTKSKGGAEVKPENIEVLADYVRAQKAHADEERRIKLLKQADMKQKLETFKQTKEQLRDKLKGQIDAKEWKPLEAVFKSADKGGVGIYILYNQTKNKYYIGQAKQLYKRVRDHFSVEEIARDYMAGDKISVKFLTANELDSDYRLDHIEKTGIELFNADKEGYNKTTGNL